MPARKNDRCRYCGSNKLTKYLSLGQHPPSNSFLKIEQVSLEERFPLEVYLCEGCFLSQLIDVVPAEIIFDDYVYLSSTSKALKNHYAKLAQQASERFSLKEEDTVVDIGCNDGVLLCGYTKDGIVKVGVEPSKVAELARKAGFDVFKNFFDQDCAKKIIARHGHPKIVTATNVYVHVDDISEFTKGVRLLLENDGVFIVEASYLLDLIDQALFDTIYHEHLCYLSLTPLVPFLDRHDLEVFDVERIALGASGPALRVYVQKKNGKERIESSVSKMLQDEKAWGIGDIKRYKGYAAKVQKIKDDVLMIISRLQKEGKVVGGYGAPAKGNTLLNYFDLNEDIIPFVAENNPMKQGMLTPGSHIPIISDEEFLKQMPDYALLLSWNYLDFFLANSEYIRRGGKFIIPIPQLSIRP